MICCTAVGYAVIRTARFMARLFFPHHFQQAVENPYIKHQKIKLQNDKFYKDYLKWMQKHDPEGNPVDKVKTRKEIEAEKKFNDLIK